MRFVKTKPSRTTSLLNVVASPRHTTEKSLSQVCASAIGLLMLRGGDALEELSLVESNARDYLPWLKGEDIADPHVQFKSLQSALKRAAKSLDKVGESLREYMRACGDGRSVMWESLRSLEEYKEKLESLTEYLERAHSERKVAIPGPGGFTVRVDNTLYDRVSTSEFIIIGTLKGVADYMLYLTT